MPRKIKNPNVILEAIAISKQMLANRLAKRLAELNLPKTSSTRHYLCIPYEEKDHIRLLFPNLIFWDEIQKLWYTINDCTYFQLADFNLHIVHVPYAQKDKGKRMGLRWNNIGKKKKNLKIK
jgi:hypothetical protein